MTAAVQRVGPSTKVRFTTFTDTSGRRLQFVETTLAELKEDVARTKGSRKTDLPLLCLATFGEQRSAKGSLRHKNNVTEITGAAIDYDGGSVSAGEALRLLGAAGIGAVVYETPSSTPEKPRWRVLAPFSQPLPPGEHRKHTARLNGILGGIAASESFALSQSFYYGAVEGAGEKLVEVIDGDFIDLRFDLDAAAIVPEKLESRIVSAKLEKYLKSQVDWGAVFSSRDLQAMRHNNPKLWDRLNTDLDRKGRLWVRWNGGDGLRDRSKSGRDRSIVQILRSMGYDPTEAIAVAVAFGGEHPSRGRGLVDHDRAGRDIDIERYWVRCWARRSDAVPKPIDELPTSPAQATKAAEDVDRPAVEIPPPGIVGELVEYFRRASTRHLPEEVLIAAAIVTVALAAQNRFDVGDERSSTSIHVYMIILGQTGFGKSELGKLIYKLLDQKVAGSSILEDIASGPALLKRLQRISDRAPFGPTVLYSADEFGLKLQARTSRSGTTHTKDLIDEVISLFGKGNGVHSGKAYADRKNDIDPIARPSVNVLGFATEASLADALTTSDAEIGFINRFLLVWLRAASALQKPLGEVDQTPPRRVERFLQLIGSTSLTFPPADRRGTEPDGDLGKLKSAIQDRGPRLMPYSEGAKKRLDELTEELNRLQETSTGVLQTLWVRARQHVIIIAGVLAIGQIDIDAPQVPTVTESELEWAWAFVRRSIDAWALFFEKRVSSNDEEHAMNAIKALLATTTDFAPGRRHADRANYGNSRYNAELCEKGWMPYSLIGRELRGIRSDIRTRALAALVENEEIERDETTHEGSGKSMTVYRLALPGGSPHQAHGHISKG